MTCSPFSSNTGVPTGRLRLALRFGAVVLIPCVVGFISIMRRLSTAHCSPWSAYPTGPRGDPGVNTPLVLKSLQMPFQDPPARNRR